jgi:hypothetical protein
MYRAQTPWWAGCGIEYEEERQAKLLPPRLRAKEPKDVIDLKPFLPESGVWAIGALAVTQPMVALGRPGRTKRFETDGSVSWKDFCSHPAPGWRSDGQECSAALVNAQSTTPDPARYFKASSSAPLIVGTTLDGAPITWRQSQHNHPLLGAGSRGRRATDWQWIDGKWVCDWQLIDGRWVRVRKSASRPKCARPKRRQHWPLFSHIVDSGSEFQIPSISVIRRGKEGEWGGTVYLDRERYSRTKRVVTCTEKGKRLVYRRPA